MFCGYARTRAGCRPVSVRMVSLFASLQMENPARTATVEGLPERHEAARAGMFASVYPSTGIELLLAYRHFSEVATGILKHSEASKTVVW